MKCNYCKKDKNNLVLYARQMVCEKCKAKDLIKARDEFNKKMMPSLIKATSKVLK